MIMNNNLTEQNMNFNNTPLDPFNLVALIPLILDTSTDLLGNLTNSHTSEKFINKTKHSVKLAGSKIVRQNEL